MAGMVSVAPSSSGIQNYRSALPSFPHFYSGQTWLIIRPGSSRTSSSTSLKRGGEEVGVVTVKILTTKYTLYNMYMYVLCFVIY